MHCRSNTGSGENLMTARKWLGIVGLVVLAGCSSANDAPDHRSLVFHHPAQISIAEEKQNDPGGCVAFPQLPTSEIFMESVTCNKNTKLEYRLVANRGDTDVYKITRYILTDGGAISRSDTKEIEFVGDRIVLFEDAEHTISIEQRDITGD